MAASSDNARTRASRGVGRLISRARRSVWTAAHRALVARGESMLDWQIVNQLALLGPHVQSDLAAAVAQHPAGVCRQLEDLEEKGMISRKRRGDDRRCLEVDLTPRGRRWFEANRGVVEGAVTDVLRPLQPEEITALGALLEKLVGPERRGAARKK